MAAKTTGRDCCESATHQTDRRAGGSSGAHRAGWAAYACGRARRTGALRADCGRRARSDRRQPVCGPDARRLASILRAAVEGQWTDYLELAEEMEERDPHYRAVLGVRKRSVAQLPITVEAASDSPAHEEHADFIRRWIRRGTLRRSLFDIMDAAGKGFSAHEIIWESKPAHVWPQRMLYRPQRWFDADMIDRDTPRLRVNGGHEALPQHRYLLHVHKDKSGSLIRSGIASCGGVELDDETLHRPRLGAVCAGLRPADPARQI
ncbi:DUF935 family protein [Pannonibacter sp. Pt2-lr]